MNKNVYPQVFLEECIYIVKSKRITNYINNDSEISYDDFDEEVSSEEDN